MLFRKVVPSIQLYMIHQKATFCQRNKLQRLSYIPTIGGCKKIQYLYNFKYFNSDEYQSVAALLSDLRFPLKIYLNSGFSPEFILNNFCLLLYLLFYVSMTRSVTLRLICYLKLTDKKTAQKQKHSRLYQSSKVCLLIELSRGTILRITWKRFVLIVGTQQIKS